MNKKTDHSKKTEEAKVSPVRAAVRKAFRFLPLFLFALFIWGFSLADVLTPDTDFSPSENRTLAAFSPPTWQSLLSGDFTSKYQSYTNDQFLFREEWIYSKAFGEAMLLKTENNDIVFGRNEFLFAKESSYDDRRIDANLSYVIEFAENHPESTVYFSLVPSSSEVLKNYLPLGLSMPSQLEIIAQCYDTAADSPLVIVDVGTGLVSRHERLEAAKSPNYLYYRTDHHWTLDGAQVAYETFGDAAGFSGVTVNNPPQREVTGFYGTHYNKGKRIGISPDIIRYYEMPIEKIIVSGEEKPTLHNEAQFLLHDKYSAFLWGNNDVTVIQREGFSKVKNPKTILIVKDSYGNALVPKFLQEYDQIVVVDLRFTPDISPLFASYDFNDIYVVYSFPNFSREDNIIKLVPEE